MGWKHTLHNFGLLSRQNTKDIFWNHRQVYVYILTKLKHMIVTNSSCLKRGVLVYQKSFPTRNWSCKRLDFLCIFTCWFSLQFQNVPSTSTTQWKLYWNKIHFRNKEYLQHFFMNSLQYRNLILSSFLVLRSFYS